MFSRQSLAGFFFCVSAYLAQANMILPAIISTIGAGAILKIKR